MGDGDWEQSEGKVPRYCPRRVEGCHDAHDGAYDHIGAEEQSPERNETDRPDNDGINFPKTGQHTEELALDLRPFRRVQQPVIENTRQHEKDESDHRGGGLLVGEEARSEGPYRQSIFAGATLYAPSGRPKPTKYTQD